LQLAGRGLMLCTAETSPQFWLYSCSPKIGGKKVYLSPSVSFMICVHILQGITVYFYTPSDLADWHFQIYHPLLKNFL
jgi:hypothetical protein